MVGTSESWELEGEPVAMTGRGQGGGGERAVGVTGGALHARRVVVSLDPGHAGLRVADQRAGLALDLGDRVLGAVDLLEVLLERVGGALVGGGAPAEVARAVADPVRIASAARPVQPICSACPTRWSAMARRSAPCSLRVAACLRITVVSPYMDHVLPLPASSLPRVRRF